MLHAYHQKLIERGGKIAVENIRKGYSVYSGLPLYNGGQPQSIDEWNQWLLDPNQFEFPHQTRPKLRISLSREYILWACIEINLSSERLVQFRAISGLNKTVGKNYPMIIGNINWQVWKFWLSSHSTCPIVKESVISYHDHYGQRRRESSIRCTWSNDSYPTLINHC